MSTVENAKAVAAVAKAIGNIDLYKQIVELEGEIIDLTHEKRQLEYKVGELQALLAIQQKMTFEAPFWWQAGDETPFCASCWENKRQAIHVVLQFSNSSGTRWDCSTCKTVFMPKIGRGRRPAEPAEHARRIIPSSYT
jgi:hypothetical protein